MICVKTVRMADAQITRKATVQIKILRVVYDAVEGEVVTMPKPLLRPMRLASQRAVVMHDDERVRPDVRAMIADERARCGRGQCRFCAHLREAKPDWWEVCEDPSGIELTPMCMFCGPKERKAWLTGGAI